MDDDSDWMTEEITQDLHALATHLFGFLYPGPSLEAMVATVKALRADPELAKRLLGPQ